MCVKDRLSFVFPCNHHSDEEESER
jgi:hypothetical protein